MLSGLSQRIEGWRRWQRRQKFSAGGIGRHPAARGQLPGSSADPRLTWARAAQEAVLLVVVALSSACQVQEFARHLSPIHRRIPVRNPDLAATICRRGQHLSPAYSWRPEAPLVSAERKGVSWAKAGGCGAVASGQNVWTD